MISKSNTPPIQNNLDNKDAQNLIFVDEEYWELIDEEFILAEEAKDIYGKAVSSEDNFVASYFKKVIFDKDNDKFHYARYYERQKQGGNLGYLRFVYTIQNSSWMMIQSDMLDKNSASYFPHFEKILKEKINEWFLKNDSTFGLLDDSCDLSRPFHANFLGFFIMTLEEQRQMTPEESLEWLSR